MDAGQRGRRRIDRVTATDFLDGLAERDVAQVRAMRDDCREEELRLSYARRLVQARIDIVNAELERRRNGEASSDDPAAVLIEALPSILADHPAPGPREARAVPLYDPASLDPRRRSDNPLVDGSLAELPDRSDAELAELLERLVAEEHHVSEQRRVVLAHLDRLQAELVRRYRDGSIDVDEVVASANPPADPDHRRRS